MCVLTAQAQAIEHSDCKETGELGSCKVVKLLQLEFCHRKSDPSQRETK